MWDQATVRFVVDREIMHHLLQHYLPTALIVIISWGSFWLDVDSVPGRTTLSTKRTADGSYVLFST
jgi:hypothetical protein